MPIIVSKILRSKNIRILLVFSTFFYILAIIEIRRYENTNLIGREKAQKENIPAETIHPESIFQFPKEDYGKMLPDDKHEPASLWKSLRQWVVHTSLPTSFHRKSMVPIYWNIENVKFVKRPDCPMGNATVTFNIKSHYLKGQNRRQWIRNGWGQSRNLLFVTFCGISDVECSKEIISTNRLSKNICCIFEKYRYFTQGKA